ncbi:hypothetical protein CDD81_5526 [Ophiocordyceps australis]|uniref:ubiquitinyl hydrolase 1 n=1 Tax=Ophiocordyceps australis TaxID=1399860 RepID=A0A2C5YA52_9HYPO|nr:hypothetical protein CDD81_5526 [Ophiocordyceps australis]
MNQPQDEFGSFYEAQITARRHSLPRERFSTPWSEASVLISILALLVPLLIKLYGSEARFASIVGSILGLLGDVVTFVLPGRLLLAIDARMNPSCLADGQGSHLHHAAKKDALRRILGLDQAHGLMESVFQARNRALSVTGGMLGLKPDAQRPAGLGNLDNSCYQNSILQGLAALESFPDYLEACARIVETSQAANNEVAQTLAMLIDDLNDLSNNNKTIWTPRLLKSMSTWTQQDAQEYFSKIVEDIDKSVADRIKETQPHPGIGVECYKDEAVASLHSDDSGYQSLSWHTDLSPLEGLRNPLEGLLAQRVACVQCGHSEGLSMIPFNCLTLSLGLDKSQHDLYDRLDAFTRVETIEGVECAKCTLLKAQKLLGKLLDKMQQGTAGPGLGQEQVDEARRRLEAVEEALEQDLFDDKTLLDKCRITAQSKMSSAKTKQIVVARPPRSLVVHINRSVFDPATFDMMKNSAPVGFPLTFDLGPWCLGSNSSRTSKGGEAGQAGGEEQELWQLDAKTSMISSDEKRSRLTGPLYELRAVVTHAGRHENGHYICYRRYPKARTRGRGGRVAWKRFAGAAVENGEGQDESSRATQMQQACDAGVEEKAQWWRLSDDNVIEVDEEIVQRQASGVFMLFYECVERDMVLSEEGGEEQQIMGAPERDGEAQAQDD